MKLAENRRQLLALASSAVLTSCAGGPAPGPALHRPLPAPAGNLTPTSGARVPVAMLDQQVTFPVDGITVHGTYRHPAADTGGRKFPAVLLIAGSGPTDRDGNSPSVKGNIGTLSTFASWLGQDGVASLRYDKLGTGATHLPRSMKGRKRALTFVTYEAEASAALAFLVSRPQVQATQVGVFGHSEGALFALLLAAGWSSSTTGATPPKVAALGLLEPLSRRYLDEITEQIDTLISRQLAANGLQTSPAAEAVKQALARAVADIRAGRTVPTGLPGGLSNLLPPASQAFLRVADRYDPAAVAATLPVGTSVLLSCSDADIQVSCAGVNHLQGGLNSAGTHVVFARLRGVDHDLKEDASRTEFNYGSNLPFSQQLERSLTDFINISALGTRTPPSPRG